MNAHVSERWEGGFIKFKAAFDTIPFTDEDLKPLRFENIIA